MRASLTVFFEDPFWVGVFERIEDGMLSVCKVTFGAEPKDYEIWDYVLHHYYELVFSPAMKPECKKAFGKHRYRHEVAAGSSKATGGNENGAQADQPGGTGGGSPAPIRNEAGEEKGKEARTLMANTITFFRMTASIVLLFCPVFSPAFYTFYIAAGLSDMLDGFVARKTDTVSKLGARLDTIADFVLVVVCLIKLLPVLRIPAWLYIWIGIIALIKVVNIISGFVVQKRFVAVHSAMNKATGALLFLLPLTILVFPLKNSAIVDCAAATFAAIQEGHFIRTGRE